MSVTEVNFNNKNWTIEDVLPVHKSKKVSEMCRVKLSRDGLFVCSNSDDAHDKYIGKNNSRQNNSHRRFVKPIDILGCSWQKPQNKDLPAALLTIFAYPINTYKRQPRRKRELFKLEFKKDKDFQNNLNCAILWEKAVHQVLKINSTSSLSPDGKLLVLINPHSGPGKAYQIFRKQVVPVLSEAGSIYDVVITQRLNHAYDLMKTIKLSQYKAIAVVSGDGLLYEVFNGLGSRSDWQEALSMPVCIIPGGSGNGLAKSLAYWKKEPCSGSGGLAMVAALNLARGSPTPMDLVVLHTHTGQRLFSFLSFGVGIVSDIDIQSERLRMLGETRFLIWAIVKVAAMQKYSMTVSFKRAEGFADNAMPSGSAKKLPILQRSQTLHEDTYSAPPQFLKRSSVPGGTTTTTTGHDRRGSYRQEHRQLNHSISNQDAEEEDESDSSASSISLGQYPSLEKVVKENASNESIDCLPVNNNPEGTEISPGSPTIEESAVNATNCTDGVGKDTSYEDAATMPVNNRRKKTCTRKGDYSHLPHYLETNLSDDVGSTDNDTGPATSQQICSEVLAKPVPQDWESIKDDFIMVYAVCQSHISTTALMAPEATPDDGVMWLVLILGSTTRANVTKYLLGIETGGAEAIPGVSVIPVTAVRLETHDGSGLLTVDGESIPYGSLQAEVMPSHARVMVRQTDCQAAL